MERLADAVSNAPAEAFAFQIWRLKAGSEALGSGFSLTLLQRLLTRFDDTKKEKPGAFSSTIPLLYYCSEVQKYRLTGVENHIIGLKIGSE